MEQSTRRNFEAETTYAKYAAIKEDDISQRKKQTYPQISSVWLPQMSKVGSAGE